MPDFLEFARRVGWRTGPVSVTPQVWDQVASDEEAMEQAIRLKKLPMKVLRAAGAHPKVQVRRAVAMRQLKKDFYAVLAQDLDAKVRVEERLA